MAGYMGSYSSRMDTAPGSVFRYPSADYMGEQQAYMDQLEMNKLIEQERLKRAGQGYLGSPQQKSQPGGGYMEQPMQEFKRRFDDSPYGGSQFSFVDDPDSFHDFGMIGESNDPIENPDFIEHQRKMAMAKDPFSTTPQDKRQIAIDEANIRARSNVVSSGMESYAPQQEIEKGLSYFPLTQSAGAAPAPQQPQAPQAPGAQPTPTPKPTPQPQLGGGPNKVKLGGKVVQMTDEELSLYRSGTPEQKLEIKRKYGVA